MTKPRESVQKTPQVSPLDRRHEPRVQVSKYIRINVAGVELQARLVNESRHGFCILVPRDLVQTGQVITLVYLWGEVEARVIWTRDAGDQSQVGLFVP